MAASAQEYAARVRQLIDNAKKLSPEAEAAIQRLLEQANREILGKLASLDPASFSSWQLTQLKATIAQAMETFRRKATDEVNSMQSKSAAIALTDINAAVGAGLDTMVSHGAVNQNTLRIVQAYTADLITGLSAEATAKLNAALQRAFLGGQSLTEIIAQVGRALEGGKFSGIFTGIGDRAMKVATNEIMRAHSITAHARLEELSAANKKIQKQWAHIPAARVPRITHLLADGQVVPVSDPFTVGGEELMFPRDPKGSPGNTINCHCVLLPYIDSEELYATEEDRATLASVGLKLAA